MAHEKNQSAEHVNRVYKCMDCNQKRCARRNQVCDFCKQRYQNEDDAIRFANEAENPDYREDFHG